MAAGCFHLSKRNFSNLHKTFWTFTIGRCFHYYSEVITEMESLFVSKSADFYECGIKGLFHGYKKSVAIIGYFVKKEAIVN